MISNYRSTLRNLTLNFDAGGCKLIFDNQHNGTDDNKKAIMLDEREATYWSQDASNFLNFDCHGHYSIYFAQCIKWIISSINLYFYYTNSQLQYIPYELHLQHYLTIKLTVILVFLLTMLIDKNKNKKQQQKQTLRKLSSHSLNSINSSKILGIYSIGGPK